MYIQTNYEVITLFDGRRELSYAKFEPERKEFSPSDLECAKYWNYNSQTPDNTGSISLSFEGDTCNILYLDYSQVIGASSKPVAWPMKHKVEYLYCETQSYGQPDCYFKMTMNPDYPMMSTNKWYDYKLTGTHDRWIEAIDSEIRFYYSNTPVK